MKTYKVWSGIKYIGRKEYRVIVAAYSQVRAAELLEISLYDLRGWWSKTGNKKDIAIATRKPESVFIREGYGSGEYKELKK